MGRTEFLMDTFLGLPGFLTVTIALLGLPASSPGPIPSRVAADAGVPPYTHPHSSLQLTPITQSSSILHPLFTTQKRSRDLTGKWGETPALGLCP